MATSKLKKEQEETIKIEKKETSKPILFEVAWEVCNQVGGIYTVIRSKVPAMVDEWGDNYCLIGPYFAHTAGIEFDRQDDDDSIFSQAAQSLRGLGFDVFYGRWLVTGNPRIILIDFNANLAKVDSIKYDLWEKHKISTINCEELVNKVLAFGDLVRKFLQTFVEDYSKKQDVIAHFHEWMASTALIDLRKDKVNIGTVFTTHATMLGRYIAGNVNDFYEQLPHYKWDIEAKNYGIEAQAGIERQ